MEKGETNSVPTRSTVLLKPVDVPKASDVLARELRERILSGELVEGTALPAERELVKQTQMSRATVREALRILEVQNLVRVRAGRAGGASAGSVCAGAWGVATDCVRLVITTALLRLPRLSGHGFLCVCPCPCPIGHGQATNAREQP